MTVVIDRPTHHPPVEARDVLGGELFDRLAARIVVDHPEVGRLLAERIVTQMVGYLQLSAVNTGPPLVPSPMVDIGWHTFIIHTKDYAAFCQRVAGRFLHHVPDDTLSGAAGATAVGATVAALRAAGVRVDPELWLADSKCSQCHQGCYDDPRVG